MSLQNIKKLQSQRGFTLVELLIVIVIIAILAAITIVAYNGITNRAHTSASQQAAQNVINKAEAYNAETGAYPLTSNLLTNATTDKSYNLPSSAANFVTTPSTANSDNSVSWAVCPSGANAATITGVKVGYYKYDGSAGIQYMYAGASC